MNRTERAYAQQLELRRRAGELQWWAFEPLKLRLADSTFYTPDFVVLLADGTLEAHEVKATWTKGRHRGRAGWQEDARVKVKVAASLFPWIQFVALNPLAGGWNEERFEARPLGQGAA